MWIRFKQDAGTCSSCVCGDRTRWLGQNTVFSWPEPAESNQPINTATWNMSAVCRKASLPTFILAVGLVPAGSRLPRQTKCLQLMKWMFTEAFCRCSWKITIPWIGGLCDWLIFAFLFCFLFPETCWLFGFIMLESFLTRGCYQTSRLCCPQTGCHRRSWPGNITVQCVSFKAGLRGRLCSLHSVRTYTTWWKSFYICVQLNNEQQSGWCTDWRPSETWRRPSCICALKYCSHLI